MSICCGILTISSFAHAQTTTPGSSTTITSTIPSTNQGIGQQARITNLKTRATTEISRRTTALNILITEVSSMRHLTTTQQSIFTTQVQDEITALTAVQTKINADTDLSSLKTDVQSVIGSYRVFALFIPQIHILNVADRILTVITSIKVLIPKLQTRIQTAQSRGANLTSLQASLTDMQSKLSDTQTQVNNIMTTITPLVPTGYPANKTTLQGGRTQLQTAIKDLRTINQDVKSIILGLQSFKGNSPTLSIIPNSSAPSH